jgi:hypothetical protein
MRKNTLIYVSIALLVLALGVLWLYENGPHVKIVSMNASPIGARESGQLDIVLQNNGSKPVDVWLEVENTFVDGDGVSHPASRMIISNYSGESYDESFSLQKPLHLLPGNSSVGIWIGYVLPGEYPINVKVVVNKRLLDEGTYLINISPPIIPENISLKLEYEKESINTSEIYRIYGYLINKGPGSASGLGSGSGSVFTNFTVTDEKTGEEVFNSAEFYDVGEYDKTPLRAWPDYPYAVVEIANGEPSGKSYMPVKNVVRGKKGDSFRINVTSTWQNHTISAELVLPQEGEGR